MPTIRRLFLASLFFTLTVSVAIWFYPGIENWFSRFNSSVQGGIGSTAYAEVATGALDVGLALLCTSSVFYVAMLVANRKKANPPVDTPVNPPPPAGKGDAKSARLRCRLLLIPAFLVFQYVRNLFSGMSAVGSLEGMTSLGSLFFSFVVVVVVVLYANGYEVAFGSAAEKPKSAVETKK
jgi:hypothetical protein